MKKITTYIIGLLAVFSLIAQKKATWNLSFDQPVVWQKVTSLGQLIVHSGTSMIGVNTDSGEKIWKVDGIGNLDIESYEGIGNSNFFTISTAPDGSQFMLINSLDGKVLMNSKDEGVATILSSDILPGMGLLIMVAEKIDAGQASLLAFDINSGSIRWENDDIFKVELDQSFGKGAFGAMIKQAASNLANEANKLGLMAKPLAIASDKLLLLHPNFTYCINPDTGEELWNMPNEGGAFRASAEINQKQPGTVFLGIEKEQAQNSGATFTTSSGSNTGPATMFELYALDIATGKPKWDKPYRDNGGALSTLIFDIDGIIVSPPVNGSKVALNSIDYNTGEGKWGKKGKGIKVKGSIVDFNGFEGGYMIVISYDNAWNNAGAEFYINILNPIDGSKRFEKDLKLNGDLISTDLLNKGLLYITTLEINILDLITGEQLFDSPQAAKPLDASNFDPVKHILPYTDNGQMLYTFSSKDGLLYEISKETGTIKSLGEKIKFEGKEVPYLIESHEDGIVLSAEQNIMKIGLDGAIKYQNYFPAPREPGLLRAVAAAQALRAAYIGAASAAYSAAFAQAASETDEELGKEIGNEFAQGFGELSRQGFAYSKDAMSQATARFTASAKTPEFMFILTEMDKKQYGLVQVDKRSGQKISMIDLGRDKEPSYDLDEIFSRVYYRSDVNQIACYQF